MKSRIVAWLAPLAGLALLSGCGRHSQPTVPAIGTAAPPATTPATPNPVPSGPVVNGPARHILALGDSLFAGYGLRPDQAYPPQLEAALRASATPGYRATPPQMAWPG